MVAVAQSTGLARSGGAKRMVALVRSEFTKIRTVRSTYLTLIALVVITAGLSCVISWAIAAHWAKESASSRASLDPTSISLTGLLPRAAVHRGVRRAGPHHGILHRHDLRYADRPAAPFRHLRG